MTLQKKKIPRTAFSSVLEIMQNNQYQRTTLVAITLFASISHQG